MLTTLKFCLIVDKGVSKSVDPKTSICDDNSVLFPLKPLDNGLIHSILTDVCHAMSLSQFKEASCCIGSQLMPIAQLSSNCHMKRFMSMLKISGVIRTEILSSDQNILDI